MATQAQKERQLRALARKGKSEGLTDSQVIEKLEPVAQKPATPDAPIVETAKKDVKPSSVDAIGVPKTAQIAETPQEQATQGKISDTQDTSGTLIPQTQESIEIDTQKKTSAPVMLNMSISTPTQIARGVKTGQISVSDYQLLAQTDPEKYALAQVEAQKIEMLDQINQGQVDYIEAQRNKVADFERQVSSIGGGQEAVDEFNQFFKKSDLGDVALEKARRIAEIDNDLRNMFDNLIEETGNADLSYVEARMRNARKESLDERQILVAEYGALQAQQEIENQQALQQYNIYRQGEEIKRAYQNQILEQNYGITMMEIEQRNKQLENQFLQAEQTKQEIEGFFDDQERQAAYEKSIEQEKMSNAAMLSLYQELPAEDKAVLVDLPAESLKDFLAQYNEINKQDEQKYNFEKFGDGYVIMNESTGDIVKSYTPPVAGSIPSTVTGSVSVGEIGGQCGTFARSLAGMTALPGGNSKSQRKQLFNDTQPQVGGLVFFDGDQYDKTYGHIAAIESVNDDGTINIVESNLKGDEKVSRRTISPTAPGLSGFYNDTPLAKGFQSETLVKGVSPLALGLSSASAERFDASIKDAVESGNKELALSTIREAYRSTLTADGKKKLDARTELSFRINELGSAFEDYVSSGGDLGFFTGRTEDMLNAVGKTKDPELAALQTRVINLLDNVARDRTGAAMTESEEAFYKKLLPGVGKTIEYNRAVIQGLQESMGNQEKYVDFAISQKMTGEARNWLYGDTPIDVIDDGVKRIDSIGDLYLQMGAVTNSSGKTVQAKSYFE